MSTNIRETQQLECMLLINSLLNMCIHVLGLEVTRAARLLHTKTVLLNTKNNHKPHKKTTDKPIVTV